MEVLRRFWVFYCGLVVVILAIVPFVQLNYIAGESFIFGQKTLFSRDADLWSSIIYCSYIFIVIALCVSLIKGGGLLVQMIWSLLAIISGFIPTAFIVFLAVFYRNPFGHKIVSGVFCFSSPGSYDRCEAFSRSVLYPSPALAFYLSSAAFLMLVVFLLGVILRALMHYLAKRNTRKIVTL